MLTLPMERAGGFCMAIIGPEDRRKAGNFVGLALATLVRVFSTGISSF